ncbi:MAG: M48 family metallopeptidase [Clostridiales Family XIII bacterium]|jgi:predicted metal-dependent hydrolase|nr:M48 family metallopeptidase [Clostridiales Family XIII bacterium]
MKAIKTSNQKRTLSGIHYHLIRARRRSLAIHITKDAQVEVRAPLKLPESEIERFILDKRAWIVRSVEKMRDGVRARESFSLGFGDWVTVCGRACEIVPTAADVPSFADGKLALPARCGAADIQQSVIYLLKQVADRVLREKTDYFAKRMRVTPTSVQIGNARSRWGSCSGDDKIRYSWRIVMGDEETIDYLVVHELAHIKQHNHSRYFWDEVAAILPDYRARRKKLRALQERQNREQW